MTDGAEGLNPTVLDEGAGSQLARSYAQALLGAAEKEGRADAVLDDLDELISDVWRAWPEFARLLASPTVAIAEKDRILAEAFEGRADPLLVRFLRVLNRHGRLGLLEVIAGRARVDRERRQGRRRATVRSAVPLDEGQQDTLRGKVAAMTRAEPIIRFEVDPELIGGLVVQVGDEVYDASIRSRLRSLRRTLVEQRANELSRNREAFTVS